MTYKRISVQKATSSIFLDDFLYAADSKITTRTLETCWRHMTMANIGNFLYSSIGRQLQLIDKAGQKE